MLLVGLMLAAFPAFAIYGYSIHGLVGLAAAAVAGTVCLFGATMALLCQGLTRSGPNVVGGLLLGMAFRFGIPLATGLILYRLGGPLAEAGVFGMIVVYYLLGLTIETTLSVRLIGSSSQKVVRAS